MKKPKLLVFLVLFVVVAVVAASTFAVVAYMIRRSEQLQNEFIPASVECLPSPAWAGWGGGVLSKGPSIIFKAAFLLNFQEWHTGLVPGGQP